MLKPYIRKNILRITVPLLIIGVFYVSPRVYPIWEKGLSWRDMDWNKDGSTSLSEILRASDLGVREILREGETCKEFFDYKDDQPIKSSCSQYSGSDYWFYKLVSKKFEKQNIGNSIVLVKYFYQENWNTFWIKKVKIEKYENVYKGYLEAFDHYLDLLVGASPQSGFRYRKKNETVHPVTAHRAQKKMIQLTGGGIPIRSIGHWKYWRKERGSLKDLRYSDCFKALVKEVSPDLYWYFKILEKPMVVVKNKDRYGYLCLKLNPESPGVVIKGDKIQGFKAKSEGYKMVLSMSISSLRRNRADYYEYKGIVKETNLSDEEFKGMFKENNGARQRIFQDLAILTGMDFKSSEEWLEWYRKNRARLVLSEEKEHLIVKP